MNHFSISAEISRAIDTNCDALRMQALRSIAEKLSETAPGPRASSPLTGEVIKTLHEQALARVYNELQSEARTGPLDELNVIRFANNKQVIHVICAIARLSGLPVASVEQAFTGPRPDLLLVLCRMQNYAWSTVRLLLSMRCQPPTGEESKILFEEYHDMSIPQACRFTRFLYVHQQGRAIA